ncbi:redoxin domain-containing protein [Planctomycetota bacterium]
MKSKMIVSMIIFGGLFYCPFSRCHAGEQEEKSSYIIFEDEPVAHTLYEKMIKAMLDADNLSYESDYRSGEIKHYKYSVWMKMPNYFRLEVTMSEEMTTDSQIAQNNIDGILIGNGEDYRLYWPNGRPTFTAMEQPDGSIAYSYTYRGSYSNTYLKGPAPAGQFSIGHATPRFGCMDMPIINPSIFHGYTGSFERHGLIDGIRSMGTERIADEECDVIEVSIQRGQRCWHLWLSRRDHLPRRLKEIIRLADRISIKHETWSKVSLNADIPRETFAWNPPEGWQERHVLGLEQRLLKPGQDAPDFNLASTDGNRIKLSDYRGKVVWLTFWRVGCPPCLKEMPYLSNLYGTYQDKGLVVLGFNCTDEKERALDVLRENSADFPNIVDASSDAKRISHEYQLSGVPLNYIIDRQGKVAAAWYGYKEGDKRGVQILEKLGIK